MKYKFNKKIWCKIIFGIIIVIGLRIILPNYIFNPIAFIIIFGGTFLIFIALVKVGSEKAKRKDKWEKFVEKEHWQ